MKKQKKLQEHTQQKLHERADKVPIYKDLQENLTFVDKTFGDSSDIVTRSFKIPYAPEREAAVIYIDGLTNARMIDEDILRSLSIDAEQTLAKQSIVEWIEDRLLPVGETKKSSKMKEMIKAVLDGDTVLFIDECEQGFIMSTRQWPSRGVEEPSIESVIRGSREGFTETIRMNTALIRRRLRDPDLRLLSFTLGKRTKTDIGVFYIDGIMDEKIVSEIKKRLKKIDIDGVLESGYIEEFIEDSTWTPFPQIQGTERPDACVAHLLEGKAIILVDGTPFALVAPAVFTQFYYSPEDYYSRYLIASFVRFIRLIALFIALLLPALYIAFISFHTEMIPSQLAIALAAGRASVPFPSLIEALLMEISVEILREASVRLPGPIGPTIGIVGALVIGDAAVTAGIVSPFMVIVVALTTICSYANPNYSAAIAVRLVRFPLMFLAATVGLYGVMLGLMLLTVHLVKLKSFGVPYLAPLTPLKFSDLKDSFIRVPWKWMNFRPQTFNPREDQREDQVKPEPSEEPS